MIDLRKNNVKVFGNGRQTLVFAHGYGCDQGMWRYLVSQFANDYRIVLFDYVGHGNSDASAFDPMKYSSLGGYAQDVIDVCDGLGLRGAIFIGHSVSAMIGLLVTKRRPDLFESMVLIGPSPCYVNAGDYHGGFEKADIDGLLDALDANHLGWSSSMGPVIMGNASRPELAEELINSFCRTSPEVAKHFARVTFLSDNRADLSSVKTPALIIQCSDDVIADEAVGRYVHQHLSDSTFVHLNATGHCPHLSAPEETGAAIRAFLVSREGVSRAHA